MSVKNDYTKEVQGLKVTGRWLKWWFVFWVWQKVTGSDPGIPLYLLSALVTVCLPFIDLLYAPIDRWLDKKIKALRLRRSMRDDRDGQPNMRTQ